MKYLVHDMVKCFRSINNNYVYAGRHPCIWCIIRADQMKQPRQERGTLQPRSLESLEADYLCFQGNGKSDIRKAKEYNNVIRQVFFNIPLSKVSSLIDK